MDNNKDNEINRDNEERDKDISEAIPETEITDNDGELTINITAKLTKEQYKDLLFIKNWYRSPSISHTLRLMIPDVARGCEQNAPKSRFTE